MIIFFLIFANIIAGFLLINLVIYFSIDLVIILSRSLFSFLLTFPNSRYLSIHRCNVDFLQSNNSDTSLILYNFKYNLTADNLKSEE